MSISELLAMGGYGIYVWSAYGITFSILLINLFFSFLERKQVRKKLKEYLTTHES